MPETNSAKNPEQPARKTGNTDDRGLILKNLAHP
jgi:hypothetical protein